MSKAVTGIGRQYLSAVSKWPKDNLRPSVQLQDLLRKRVEKLGDTSSPRELNAVFSLLENRYQRTYPLTSILKPRSNPGYFDALITELEEGPKRSWLARLWKQLSGRVRLQ